ncbi:MAG: hypothetical protein ABI670_22455 [Chloroflexota bacterium]
MTPYINAVWAAGHDISLIAMHCNGSSWSTPARLDVEGWDNRLSAMAAVPGSSGGVMWALAVGSSSADDVRKPLILRYTGCATPGTP